MEKTVKTWPNRLPIITVMILLLPFLAMAQGLDPQKAITQYSLQTWQKKDGLPSNSITAIEQTPDGYLWLGNTAGLVRFDGVRFTVFNPENTEAMKSGRIRALLTDQTGRLWIATSGGLVFWEDGVFNFHSSERGLDQVVSMAEAPDSSLWLATQFAGLLHLKGNELNQYTHESGLSRVNVVRFGLDQTLLVATNGGVFRLVQGELDLVILGPTYALAENGEGLIWAGVTSYGLIAAKSSTSARRYTRKDGLTNDNIGAILADRMNNLWLGTSGGGLNRFKSGRFEVLTERHGLAGDVVTALFEDREGLLWIGTDGGGLSVLRDGIFTTYTETEGVAENVISSVLEDRRGNVWMGTRGGGASRLNKDGTITTFTSADGLANDKVFGILEDKAGNIWFSTRGGGLSRFRSDLFTNYGKGRISSLFTYEIAESADGSLWIATDGGGLNHYKNGQFTREAGLPGWVRTVREDKTGTLWIGGGGGLGRWSEGRLVTLSEEDGLPAGRVHYLYEDQEDKLWIVANGRLCRYAEERITEFSAIEGLDKVEIRGVVDDDIGNLWLNTDDDIVRVAKQHLDDYALGKRENIPARRFGEADGLKSSRGGGGAPNCWRGHDGRLWFATQKGVAMLDPSRTETELIPSPVYIEKLTVDEEPIALDDEIELTPGKRRFTFGFTAVNLGAPESVRFQYILEGYDDDWIDGGRSRTAYYTGLPPGQYRFRVAVSEGVENSNEANLSFSLQPFFYQTSWFYLLVAFGLVGLGAGGYSFRVRRLKQRERELQKVVEQRTDSLRREKEKSEELYTELQADHARKTQKLEEARDLQLSMLPENPPVLENIEIAVHMSTATEVGGDYYDFKLDNSGTLTVAVGDATGHGMKAGLVVATTKSYFQSLAAKSDSLEMARQTSRGLKDMKMRGMYMSLMLLKYKDGSATLMAAGMPPAMLYRRSGQTVEEIVLKGMPLGSVVDFPYQQQTIQLQDGDALLLMSDGLPELLNKEGEMLEEGPILDYFRDSASNGVEAVKASLLQLAEDWSEGEAQNDDITFVVLEKKG